jgi:hypothetical protein
VRPSLSRLPGALGGVKKTPDGWCTMPGQPRVCCACGQPVRITKDAIWFATHRRLSFHFGCYLRRKR